MFISYKKLTGGRAAADYYLVRASLDDGYTVDILTWRDPSNLIARDGGAVSPDALKTLLDGYVHADSPLLTDPRFDGQDPCPLVQNAGSSRRIAGYDLTMSAPKSVSVLMAAAEIHGDAALVRDLDAACRFACDEGLSRLADSGAFRVGLGPGHAVPADAVAVARIGHVTSRNGDPQTHYHHVAPNVGLRVEGGEIRSNALESSAILPRLPAARDHAYAALGGRLREMGLDVERTDTGIEVRGVDEDLCRDLSSRRQGAQEAARLRGYGDDPSPQIRNRILAATRRPKVDETRQERLDAWHEAFVKRGLTPEKVIETSREAGERARTREPVWVYDPFTGASRSPEGFTVQDPFFGGDPDAPSDPAPAPVMGGAARNALIRELRDKLETGHAVISKTEAEAAAASVARGRLDAEGARAFLADAMSSGDGVVPALAPDGTHLTGPDGDPAYTTPELRDAERRLLANALGRADEREFVPDRERRLSEVISAIEAEAGFSYSEEQRNALEAATGRSGVCVIEGSAGAGKSTTMTAARKVYEDAGYEVTGLTPSWRSVEALRGSSGIREAHAIQGYARRLDRGDVELTEKDVLVIDEAGMAGTRLLDGVLDHAKEAGSKVILTGDTRQLSAVDTGAPMEALVRLGADEGIDAYRISQVRRHSEGWQRELTEAMSRGEVGPAMQEYDRRGRIRRASNAEAAKGAVTRDCNEALGQGGGHLAVTARNRDVMDLNARLRPAYREAGRITGEDHEMEVLGRDGRRHTFHFAEGDRVIFGEKTPLEVTQGTPSNRDARTGDPFVARSQVAVIEEIRATEAGPEFRFRVDGAGVDGGPVRYKGTREALTAGRARTDPNAVPGIQHAYALTVHASQGETVSTGKGKDGLVSVYNVGGFDANTALVAMSRHTRDVRMHVPMGRLKQGDRSQKGFEAANRRLHEELTRDGRNRNLSSLMSKEQAREWALGRGLPQRDRNVTRAEAERSVAKDAPTHDKQFTAVNQSGPEKGGRQESREAAASERDRSTEKGQEASPEHRQFTAVNWRDEPVRSADPTSRNRATGHRKDAGAPRHAGQGDPSPSRKFTAVNRHTGPERERTERRPAPRIPDHLDAKAAIRRAEDAARAEEDKFWARVERKREARRDERKARHEERRAQREARSYNREPTPKGQGGSTKEDTPERQ